MLYNPFLYLLILLFSIRNCKSNIKDLSSVSWVGGKFNWPCQELQAKYASSGKYISKNIIATAAQIYKNTTFFALPRFKPGVPATLVNLTLDNDHCDIVFNAYPDLKLNEIGECKGLQNVVDLYLDSKDLLWVLDTGIINTLENASRSCPPKIIALDMQNNKIIHSLELSKLVSKTIKFSSRLQFIVAEYSVEGNSYVYVSDATGKSILAYNVMANRSYRIELPERITTKVETCKVLYLLLVHKSCGSYLIFSYLTSCHLYQIRTDHIFEKNFEDFIEDLGPKEKNTAFLGSYNAFVFFRYTDERDIYRWDSNTLFMKRNFLKVYTTNDELFSTQVMAQDKGRSFKVLESNFPDFIHNNSCEGAFQRVNPIPTDTKKCQRRLEIN